MPGLSAYDIEAADLCIAGAPEPDLRWRPALRGCTPVIVLRSDTRRPSLDRINWQTLQRLTLSDFSIRSARLIRIVEGVGGLPSEDETNAIDYQAIFEPSPAALWNYLGCGKYGSPPRHR